MKKIITLFVIMLAFGLNANAQQKKATAPVANQEALSKDAAFSDAAIKDIATLSEFVKLTSDQKAKLKSLFTEKHRTYAQGLSEERKSVLAEYIETTLKSSLDPAQASKIEGNTQLMSILTK